MYSTKEIEQKLRDMKPELIEKFFVKRIGYFGSYASNQQGENSDLDVLVEFSQPVGWEFFTLEIFLEEALGIQVDLVTPDALKQRIKASILNQVRYI